MILPLTFTSTDQKPFTLAAAVAAMEARGLEPKVQVDGIDVYVRLPEIGVEIQVDQQDGVVTQALVWSFQAPRRAVLDMIDEILEELRAGEARNDGFVMKLR